MMTITSLFNHNRIESRNRLEITADWLVFAIAVALPWSTSAVAILIPIWLIAFVAAHLRKLRRGSFTSSAGLPLLLWVLAAVGTLWGDGSLTERFDGLGGYHKLLVIPLLLIQFRHSTRGRAVLLGFLFSCSLLLVASWVLWGAFLLNLEWLSVPNKTAGIPVKDYIAQGSEFLVCAFALAGIATDRSQSGRLRLVALLVSMLFLTNIYLIATSRTAFIVVPVLLLILGFRYQGWKGVTAAIVAAMLLLGAAWPFSPALRYRAYQTIRDVQLYHDRNEATSTGLRIEFLRKSWHFFAAAPLLGHGTGAIPGLFRSSSLQQSGATAIPSVNPHSQVLAVAIQLGLVGATILILMWGAHLALFTGKRGLNWMGIVIVVQNVISSLFNSHLFDFLHGWLYVFGIGVVGGMVLHETSRDPRRGTAILTRRGTRVS